MKKFTSLMMAAAMVLALVACGNTNQPAPPAASNPAGTPAASAPSSGTPTLTAALGHVMAADSPAGKGADYFAQKVAEKTNGAISITVNPNSQLGGDRDMIEGQQMGALEFSLPGTSIYSQFEPSLGTFCLPFLYSDYEEAHKVLDNEAVMGLYDCTQNQNITVLTTFESGFRQLGSNKKAVNTLADLKGQIIRIPQGDIYTQTWSALGVNGTPLAWNELFSALQTGVVDGEEAPLANFASSGFGEVCKNFAYINYAYDPLMLTVSNDFWNKLTDEQKAAVKEAAYEARDYQRQLNAEAEASLEASLKEQWDVNFTHPDLAEFKTAVQPVYDSWTYPDQLKVIQDVQAGLK